MTRINTLKTSFGAGELAPRLAGRPDLAAYRDGARRLRNVAVHATGGLSRRPGLAFVEAAPGPGRLAAFEFNTEESYLLLFTDRALRIYRNGARTALVAAPWREADLAGLNWTQTADTLLVVHPDYPPQTVARRAGGGWRIAPWQWADRGGRSMQPYHRYAPPSVTLTPSAASGRIRLTASAEVFAPEDEGQPFRIGADEVRIRRVVSATEAEADVAGALAGGTAATPDWREPAFSPRRGWPVSAVFHQNRLVIGGSRALPDRLWLSRSGAFFDFDPGEGLDDEAIAFPLLSDQANAVRAVVSGRHLQVFTSGAEWTVSGDPLTPASIQLRRQTRIGSPADRAVRPVDVEGATFFLARNGRELREFLFADAELAYRARDLALLASHLFAAPAELAWDGAARRLLVVMGDGSIAALTAWRAEGVHAWTRFGTDGAFRSAAVAGGRAWALVEREGRFSVERFDEALGVDAAVSGAAVRPTRSWGGLAHLEGREVAAVADGRALSGLRVAGGRIMLDAPARRVEAGLAFAHEVEPLAPGVQLARGAMQGAAHRAVRVTLRLDRTRALRCDTGFGFRRAALGGDAFTGDVSLGAGGWRRDGAAPLWRIEDASPLPFHLLSAATELKVTDI